MGWYAKRGMAPSFASTLTSSERWLRARDVLVGGVASALLPMERVMNKPMLALLAVASTALPAGTTLAVAQVAEPHGWLNNETLQTPYGNFQFKNGYPAGDSGQRLLDIQMLNRA